ncbi:hypothetical protein [Mesorhizobium sp. B2-3-10]|uniref:hypothetical protein n=1 Tax=unclassified Mesorhizobium TaxID=325217 RepID=UPI0032B283BB
MAWKIGAGIHREALKLWLRGARFVRARLSPDPQTTGTRQWRSNRRMNQENRGSAIAPAPRRSRGLE